MLTQWESPDKTVRIVNGDSLQVLPTLPEASIEACVCDPPYELAFMGKRWDASGVAFCSGTWEAVYRVLKPGAYLLAFGGSRTYHRLACAIEDAGFEIRDCLIWCYGSGFPKALDVSKAIDKQAGAERKVVGTAKRSQVQSEGWDRPWRHEAMQRSGSTVAEYNITAPATAEAARWSGWASALKPAYEPIVVARKPLDGTIAQNVLTHGAGAMNIGACRVGTDKTKTVVSYRREGNAGWQRPWNQTDDEPIYRENPAGRYPSNLILSYPADETDAEGNPLPNPGKDEVLACFPETGATMTKTGKRSGKESGRYGAFAGQDEAVRGHDDAGGSAARYFQHCPFTPDETRRLLYYAKAAAEERNGSKHPTVKPLSLIRYLVRLVTPPEGTVLDLFLGSGTTALAAYQENVRCLGIEREPEYYADALARMKTEDAKYPLFQ